MASKGLPVNVQNNRGAPQERAIADIISAVNTLLNYTNTFTTYNYIPMGYANGTFVTGTWYYMRVDGTNPMYYIQDVDTYLMNTTLTVDASTGSPNVLFRLLEVNSGKVLWNSAPIATGTQVLGGQLDYGQVKMLAGQTYAFQFQMTAGTLSVQAQVAMKVAY